MATLRSKGMPRRHSGALGKTRGRAGLCLVVLAAIMIAPAASQSQSANARKSDTASTELTTPSRLPFKIFSRNESSTPPREHRPDRLAMVQTNSLPATAWICPTLIHVGPTVVLAAPDSDSTQSKDAAIEFASPRGQSNVEATLSCRCVLLRSNALHGETTRLLAPIEKHRAIFRDLPFGGFDVLYLSMTLDAARADLTSGKLDSVPPQRRIVVIDRAAAAELDATANTTRRAQSNDSAIAAKPGLVRLPLAATEQTFDDDEITFSLRSILPSLRSHARSGWRLLAANRRTDAAGEFRSALLGLGRAADKRANREAAAFSEHSWREVVAGAENVRRELIAGEASPRMLAFVVAEAIGAESPSSRTLYGLAKSLDGLAPEGETARSHDLLAEVYYLAAIQINHNYCEAHNDLAVLLARSGREDEALGHLLQSYRQRPDAVIGLNIAQLLARQNQLGDARHWCRRILAADNRYAPAARTLAETWLAPNAPAVDAAALRELVADCDLARQMAAGRDQALSDSLDRLRAQLDFLRRETVWNQPSHTNRWVLGTELDSE